MGGEKSTPVRDGSGPMNPMSHAPALRQVNISGMVGCPTGKISAPIRAPRARAMSRRMIPTEAPFGSPVRGSVVYMTECTPTRILPAFRRSATRASETCCASARLANMAAKVTERRSIFICASKARGWLPQANAGSLVELRIRVSGVTEFLRGRRRGSLRLDVGRPDHLAPLLGLNCDELAEVGGREREHIATHVGKPRLELGIGQASVDLVVELLDNLCRRILGCADAIPRWRLVARYEITHSRQVRQRARARRGGHRQGAEFVSPDVFDR